MTTEFETADFEIAKAKIEAIRISTHNRGILFHPVLYLKRTHTYGIIALRPGEMSGHAVLNDNTFSDKVIKVVYERTGALVKN